MKIACKDLDFSYTDKNFIQRLNLNVHSGDHIWIQGRSGSGKSSLLMLIAGLLKPVKGQIRLDEFDLSQASEAESRNFREKNIGFVHQENHLIDHWTVGQNLNLVIVNDNEVSKNLGQLGLDPSIVNKPAAELSGGEKQRVSLCRLILQKPRLALLDEPTSHLDDQSAEKVFGKLKESLAESTLIVVSHDARLENMGLKKFEFGALNK